MGERKIKILVVIPMLKVGGAERLTVYLLRRLNREKFEVALCLFEDKGELRREVPLDVKRYCLHKKNRWSFFQLLYRFKQVVADFQPDVIYSYLWYATAVAVLSQKLFASKVPVIANEPHNHKRDILKRDPFRLLKRFFMDWSHQRARVVVVDSLGVKADLVASYGLLAEKIKVIYNSVDLDYIQQNTSAGQPTSIAGWFEEEIPIIVAFGRLIGRKGFPDLIQAFKLVRQQRPARLLFIGEGEERQNLERLVEESGLNADVQFLGYVENPFNIIAHASVFVLSSHWEGFGNVIIEAMACGTAVIATNCPYGPEEILSDGENGLLVPVGDANTLAAAILKLLEDEPLRRRLAEAGRRRAEDFRVEKMVHAFERLFMETDQK